LNFVTCLFLYRININDETIELQGEKAYFYTPSYFCAFHHTFLPFFVLLRTSEAQKYAFFPL
jgi:hypothetical protein